MSQITVNMDTAKKLKRAWRTQLCDFCYDSEWFIFYKNSYNYTDYPWPDWEIFEAPTAQEILDELRIYIDTKSNEYGSIVLSMEWSATRWACFYSDIKRQCNYKDMHFVWDSLAEAVAEIRLRCKENWLI
jgi:hypothetical protein